MGGTIAAWLVTMSVATTPPPGDQDLATAMTKCELALEPTTVLSPVEIGRSQRLRFAIDSSGQGRDAIHESSYHLLDPSTCRLVVLERVAGGGSPLEHAWIFASKGKLSADERRVLLDWAGVVSKKEKDTVIIPQLASLGDAPSTGAEIWASKPAKFRWQKKPSVPEDRGRKLSPKECEREHPEAGGEAQEPATKPRRPPKTECYELFLGTKFEPAGKTEVDGSTLVFYATKARNSSLLLGLETKDGFAWVGWVFNVSQPKVLGRHEAHIWIKVRNLDLGDQLIAINLEKASVQRVGLIADGTIDGDEAGLTLDEAPLFDWKRVVSTLTSVR